MARDAGMKSAAITKAVEQLEAAVAAKKCWACNCFYGGVTAIEEAWPMAERPAAIQAVLAAAGTRLTTPEYDCLGCDICYPAVVLNELAQAGVAVGAESCPVARSQPAQAGLPCQELTPSSGITPRSLSARSRMRSYPRS